VTKLVGWAVTLAMTVVLSANCFAAAGKTPEQRACCAAMHHDCGGVAIERGCCSGEAKKLSGLTPAALKAAAAPPAVVLIAVLDAPEPAMLTANVRALATLSLEPPGAPPYLLASALRI
jgi:hypothetical protein